MRKFTFVLLVSLLSFISCNDNESTLSSLENQTLSVETFFEKVSAMNLKTSKENIIYIDYEWDTKNKTIKYLGFEEKEPDFFILESDESVANRATAYEVSCDRGGDGTKNWHEDCDGKWSCGKLIAKCLDEGGCATICQQKMAYIPQTKTFYIN